MRKLITARARKNKRTARMLANARKDHSILLEERELFFRTLPLVRDSRFAFASLIARNYAKKFRLQANPRQPWLVRCLWFWFQAHFNKFCSALYFYENIVFRPRKYSREYPYDIYDLDGVEVNLKSDCMQ